MKKLLRFIIFAGLCCTLNQAQVLSQFSKDSLLLALKLAKHDTTRCNILTAMIEAEPDDLVWPQYNEQLFRITALNLKSSDLKLHNFYLKKNATALNNTGFLYNSKGNISKALENYLKALKIQAEIKDKSGMASSLINIGVTYDNQGDIPLALEYYHKSLKIQEEINDREGIAISLNNIAFIYNNQGDTAKALEYFNKSLKIRRELNNKEGIASSLSNIGSIYESQGNLKKALGFYQTSLSMREDIGDKEGISSSLNVLGNFYKKQNDLTKALEYCLKSLDIREKIEDKEGIAYSLNDIADIYFRKKEFAKAIQYANLSLKTSQELSYPENIKKAASTLKDIFMKQNKFKESLEMYTLEIKMRDSLSNKETRKASLRHKMQYQYEKREAALKAEQDKKNAIAGQEKQISTLKLNQSRYIMYGLCAVVLIVLCFAYLLLRQNKFRAEQRTMQLEQKLLRSQMNPHFIFNSLIAIESFIYSNEPREAGKYLSGFAKLMRLILENSREEYISLDKEIKTLEHYLALQKLRFEEKFNYSIEIQEGLDAERTAIPPMLAQPFIENSIEHGLKNLQIKGHLTVRFSRLNNDLVFEVQDNGIGIERSLAIKQEVKEHKSLATLITKERLMLLNKGKKEKIKMMTEDLKDSFNKVLGARISFKIPLKEI